MANFTAGTVHSDHGTPAWTNCTAASGLGDFCENEVPPGAPVSMCGAHLVAAYRFCEEALGEAERSEKFERLVSRDRRRSGETGPAVVYYMLFGKTIKIGATTNIHQRVRQLRPDALLATEPGYFDLERQRHEQFRKLKVDDGRYDYFLAGAALIRFIEALPKTEAPNPPRRPDRTAAAVRGKRDSQHIGPNGQLSMLKALSDEAA